MDYRTKKVIASLTIILLIAVTPITLLSQKDMSLKLICLIFCAVAVKLGSGLIDVYKTKENEEM